jgi:AcrR family transcriptional regulator
VAELRALRSDSRGGNGEDELAKGKAGRPAKVTSDDIVRAALELGIEHASIRNLADALGMSVPGPYHHVRTREQLRDMVAEWWFAQLLANVRSEGSFEDLLRSYAHSLFRFIADHPEMIDSIRMGGGMGGGRITVYLEQMLGHGVRCGFTPVEAFDAFTAVTGSALGAAVVEASVRALRRRPDADKVQPASSASEETAEARELARLIRSNAPHTNQTLDLTFEGLRAAYGTRLSTKPPRAP